MKKLSFVHNISRLLGVITSIDFSQLEPSLQPTFAIRKKACKVYFHGISVDFPLLTSDNIDNEIGAIAYLPISRSDCFHPPSGLGWQGTPLRLL